MAGCVSQANCLPVALLRLGPHSPVTASAAFEARYSSRSPPENTPARQCIPGHPSGSGVVVAYGSLLCRRCTGGGELGAAAKEWVGSVLWSGTIRTGCLIHGYRGYACLVAPAGVFYDHVRAPLRDQRDEARNVLRGGTGLSVPVLKMASAPSRGAALSPAVKALGDAAGSLGCVAPGGRQAAMSVRAIVDGAMVHHPKPRCNQGFGSQCARFAIALASSPVRRMTGSDSRHSQWLVRRLPYSDARSSIAPRLQHGFAHDPAVPKGVSSAQHVSRSHHSQPATIVDL